MLLKVESIDMLILFFSTVQKRRLVLVCKKTAGKTFSVDFYNLDCFLFYREKKKPARLPVGTK
jgi:hypothetical protein